MKASEVVTMIIAVYGAVLSTITIAKQLGNDRVRIRLALRKNMEMIGDARYDGMALTILEATNVGHRPVTITSSGALALWPNKGYVAFDTRPQLPCEITPGKFITTILDEADIDVSRINYWFVCDSHGRTHKLREASRLRHWKSTFQRRRTFARKENKA